MLYRRSYQGKYGDPEGARTCDPLLVRQMLSQLSYAPPPYRVPARHGIYNTRTAAICQGVFCIFLPFFFRPGCPASSGEMPPASALPAGTHSVSDKNAMRPRSQFAFIVSWSPPWLTSSHCCAHQKNVHSSPALHIGFSVWMVSRRHLFVLWGGLVWHV